MLPRSLGPFHQESHQPIGLERISSVARPPRESATSERAVRGFPAAWPRCRRPNRLDHLRDYKRTRLLQRSPLAPASDEPKATAADVPSRLADLPQQPYVRHLQVFLVHQQERPQSGLGTWVYSGDRRTNVNPTPRIDRHSWVPITVLSRRNRVRRKRLVGTRVTAPAFSYLRTIGDENERMVAQNSASWNRVTSWLRQLDCLRGVA